MPELLYSHPSIAGLSPPQPVNTQNTSQPHSRFLMHSASIEGEVIVALLRLDINGRLNICQIFCLLFAFQNIVPMLMDIEANYALDSLN